MGPWTRRQAISTLGIAAAIPLLSSCADKDAPDEGAAGDEPKKPAEQDPTPAPIDPESLVETRSVVTRLGEIEVGIHPLVRSGDHCVLTLDVAALHVPEGEDNVPLSRFEGDATLAGGPIYPEEWAGVRLVDVGGEQLRLAASTGDGNVAGRSSRPGSGAPESGLRRQLVFAAPETGTEQIGLLMPGWFLPTVPVVDGKVPEVKAEEEGDEMVGVEEMLREVAESPVLLLEGYSRQLDGGVEVLESTEKIEIKLAGDVLFDSSSSEIDARADAVLEAAAASIGGYEDGVVDIVGHTDDVGEQADNQVLSEKRAKAVAEELSSRIDTSVYELRTAGRGESEPLVENDSDGNRQKNRRVTVTLTSQKSSQVEVATEGELPPFDDGVLHDGTEAMGPVGFDRTVPDGSAHRISCPSARRVDGMIEVTVLVEGLDGGSDGSAVDLGAGVHSYRGDSTGYSSTFAGFAPRLLVGATATYPLDYLLGESQDGEAEEWRIASDSSASDACLEGETLRFVALYRDLPGVDTLVVEQPFVLGTAPFRLTAVPLEG